MFLVKAKYIYLTNKNSHMSLIGRGVKQNHANIPQKNILKKGYHIPKINQKILHKMRMDKKIKRKHGWFCHITVRFNSKGNFKIKENKYIRLEVEEMGETGEATELGRIALLLGRFA